LESMATGKPYNEVVAEAIAQIPLGRLETPEDVANLVAFLASDQASFITAQAYNVEGAREALSRTDAGENRRKGESNG